MTAHPQTSPQPPVHRLPDALARQVVAVRRDLHEHPELSWAEERTTAVVSRTLEAAGYG